MIASYPLLSLRLSYAHDGDTFHDVIASAAGIPEANRAELFDRVCSLVPPLAARLSLTVADSVACEAARLEDVAQVFAASALDAWGRETTEARAA